MSEDFDKEGLLFKRIGSKQKKKRRLGQKKWNLTYVNLIGGSMHYYKDEEDVDPRATIELNQLKLLKGESEGSSSKKFCFVLRNDEFDYLFGTDDEQEYNSWITAIEGNMKKGPCPPLKKEKRLNRAQQMAFKAKKNVIQKAATSTVGKKAIRSNAPEEVKNLVNSLKTVVEREAKSAKKAEEIESSIFKIGIKAYLLMDSGQLKIEELLAADKPLRAALEVLQRIHDHAKYTRNPNEKLMHEKLCEVNANLQLGRDVLIKILSPHVKPKTVVLIKDTIDYLGNPDRLMKIFQDDTLSEDLQELISAAEHYTQFHFYAED